MRRREIPLYDETIENLATGKETPPDIEPLLEYQMAINTAAADFLLEQSRALSEYEQAEAQRLYHFLTAIEASYPNEFRAVWSYPMVTARWRDFLSHADENGQISGEFCQVALWEMGAIAASLAIICNEPFEVHIPIQDRRAMLPTLGAVKISPNENNILAVCVATTKGYAPSFLKIDREGRGNYVDSIPNDLRQSSNTWEALRRITPEARDCGPRYFTETASPFPMDAFALPEIIIEDLDPFRKCFGESMLHSRLSEEEFLTWQRHIREAWSTTHQILGQEGYEAMTHTTTTLVPLENYNGTMTTSTAVDAIGAIGLGKPPDAYMLAEAFVHEAEHNKMIALFSAIELFDQLPPEEIHYSPWRGDPRPLIGHIHGIVASTAIARFWQRIRSREPNYDAIQKRAEFYDTVWRLRVHKGLKPLANVTWNEDGQRLVDYIYSVVNAPYDSHRLHPYSELLAIRMTDDHELTWKAHHLTIKPEVLEELQEAFLGKRPNGTFLEEAAINEIFSGGGNVTPASYVRQKAYELYFEDPELYMRAVIRPEILANFQGFSGLTQADLLFVTTPSRKVLELYKDTIMWGNPTPADWSGFLWIYSELYFKDILAGQQICAMPHLLRTLHPILSEQAGMAIDPEFLTAWLCYQNESYLSNIASAERE